MMMERSTITEPGRLRPRGKRINAYQNTLDDKNSGKKEVKKKEKENTINGSAMNIPPGFHG
jgi:hypothetical protein